MPAKIEEKDHDSPEAFGSTSGRSWAQGLKPSEQTRSTDISVPQAWNPRQFCLKGRKGLPRAGLGCRVYCYLRFLATVVRGVQEGGSTGGVP